MTLEHFLVSPRTGVPEESNRFFGPAQSSVTPRKHRFFFRTAPGLRPSHFVSDLERSKSHLESHWELEIGAFPGHRCLGIGHAISRHPQFVPDVHRSPETEYPLNFHSQTIDLTLFNAF
jgi:hypothetical protein